MPDSPALPEMDDETASIADAFGRGASSFGRVIPYFETFAGHLVDAAALREGEHVLDVACGTGLCSAAAAQRVGPRGQVLGIDVAPEMVQRANERFGRSALSGAKARVMEAARLELADGSFDVVLCGLGVFFFSRPEAALAEMLRVLAPGGRLAVSTIIGSRGYPWITELRGAFGATAPQGGQSPLNHSGQLDGAIAAAGFVAPGATDVEARFVFADAAAVEECFWLLRSLAESLAPEDLARFRAALAERLTEHRVPGGFELVQRARMTTAKRSGEVAPSSAS